MRTATELKFNPVKWLEEGRRLGYEVGVDDARLVFSPELVYRGSLGDDTDEWMTWLDLVDGAYELIVMEVMGLGDGQNAGMAFVEPNGCIPLAQLQEMEE